MLGCASTFLVQKPPRPPSNLHQPLPHSWSSRGITQGRGSANRGEIPQGTVLAEVIEIAPVNFTQFHTLMEWCTTSSCSEEDHTLAVLVQQRSVTCV